MNKIIYFIISIIIFCTESALSQKKYCGNKNSTTVRTRSGCNDFNAYREAVNLANTPTKTIRASIHIFQDNNGMGNFNLPIDNKTQIGVNLIDLLKPGGAGGTPDFYWLKAACESDQFSNSAQMILPTTSPRILDTKIFVQVVGIYVWRNTDMWLKNDVEDPTHGTQMYNYVMSQGDVTHKNNSIHLFFPGAVNSNYGCQSGRASGFGSKYWSMFINTYNCRSNNNNYYFNGLVAHEIGHNLGLVHAYIPPTPSYPLTQKDDCDDTPEHSGCYGIDVTNPNCNTASKISNNIMDYTNCQCAFTQCQVQIMHNSLLTNAGNLRDIMVQTITPTTPTITGPNCASTSGSSFVVSNYQAGTEASWTVTPATSVNVSSGCGQVAVITPKAGATGSITLRYNILWDNGRVTTNTKVINIQQANATVIAGNYSSPTSTTTLNSYNTTVLGTTTVRVSLASATSFKWTRTSGNATWTGGSGSYTGSSIDFNLTSINSSIAFNVEATTPCGIINQSFSFAANSWSFRAAPNPATSTLRISGTQITQPTARVAETPLKFELRLYDKYGQIVKYAKNVTGVTDVDIDVSGLKSDIYQLQIFKDKELTNQRIEIRR